MEIARLICVPYCSSSLYWPPRTFFSFAQNAFNCDTYSIVAGLDLITNSFWLMNYAFLLQYPPITFCTEILLRDIFDGKRITTTMDIRLLRLLSSYLGVFCPIADLGLKIRILIKYDFCFEWKKFQCIIHLLRICPKIWDIFGLWFNYVFWTNAKQVLNIALFSRFYRFGCTWKMSRLFWALN